MSKATLVLLLVTLFLNCSLTACSLANDADLAAKVTETRLFWKSPGVNVVVVDRQQVKASISDGLTEINGKAITSDVVFPLASCTKQFTTALMAQLVDEGVLDWNDPVAKHLPWFKLADPAANELVLVRDLLCHRTGLPAHDLLWYRSPWPVDEIVKRCTRMPATVPFRTELQYQSIMFMAAGLVCEKVTGKSWGELVESRLLTPLGMRTATVREPDDKALRRVTGHRLIEADRLVAVAPYEMKTPNSAGSIHASADDLAIWLRFLLNEGKLGEKQLVSAKNLRETWSPQTIIRREGLTAKMNPQSEQLSYGLGWVVQDYRGHLVCQHAGFIDGVRVHITLLPKDGIAFAILANLEGTRLNVSLSNQLVDHLLKLPPQTDWNKLYREVADAEQDARSAERIQRDVARRAAAQPTLAVTLFAGRYEHPAYGTMEIISGKNGLEWRWNGWKFPLSHWEVNTFKIDSDHPQIRDMFISFATNAGAVRAVRFSGLEFVPARKD